MIGFYTNLIAVFHCIKKIVHLLLCTKYVFKGDWAEIWGTVVSDATGEDYY